ncbi:MAG: hypothetical protein LJE85_15125, partial [Gammaproteobacteria bacterium]|nr:hypothetical protein [Gammaproteobacteria bacterium]
SQQNLIKINTEYITALAKKPWARFVWVACEAYHFAPHSDAPTLVAAAPFLWHIFSNTLLNSNSYYFQRLFQ